MAGVEREAGLPQGLSFSVAREPDAAELAALHEAVAADLTLRYGAGHWSSSPGERSLQRAMRTSSVFVARIGEDVVATFHLQTQKPWAIDRSYFTDVARPLYLTSMAVEPSLQRRGIGRWLLEHASATARDLSAGAIRLDAYDAAAGAGPFYERCGYHEVGRAAYRKTPLVYYELLV
jgi:GNAT superfamily N-acetyltransferase